SSLDRRYDFAVDLFIDRARYPPRCLLLDADTDERAAVLDGVRGEPDRLVEQLLMSIVRRDQRQETTQKRRRLHRTDALRDAAIDERFDVFIADELRSG